MRPGGIVEIRTPVQEKHCHAGLGVLGLQTVNFHRLIVITSDPNPQFEVFGRGGAYEGFRVVPLIKLRSRPGIDGFYLCSPEDFLEDDALDRGSFGVAEQLHFLRVQVLCLPGQEGTHPRIGFLTWKSRMWYLRDSIKNRPVKGRSSMLRRRRLELPCLSALAPQAILYATTI